MLSSNQALSVTEGSAALQAGRDVNIHQTGLSYSEVKEVALDVFRANFYELRGEANETARARAEEITEAFLTKFQQEHPLGLQKANDPDFQYSLFTVQKEYAKNGDKDLGELLVNLLIDRSKQDSRNLIQIVLGESIEVISKLTEQQIAVLSVVFFFKYARADVITHEGFGIVLDKFIAPLLGSLTTNASSFQHLEYAGCGTIGLSSISLENCLARTYRGLFVYGFEESEIERNGISIGVDPELFCTSLNDAERLQVRVINEEALEGLMEARQLSTNDRVQIRSLANLGRMNETVIKDKCQEIRPYMAGLFGMWSSSSMANLTLTSVGIAIAHANIKRLAGEFADLAIWVN